MQKPCPRCKKIMRTNPRGRPRAPTGGGGGGQKGKGFGSLISLERPKEGPGKQGPIMTGEARTRGSMANPVILRCTTCRKDFEFRGGKLTEIKPHMLK